MSSSETQKPSLLSLPDDLLLSCFARVSRLYYPSLSLVSKQFPSLLASPELYKVRSSLGNTESCLYVCLTFDLKCHWFTLCRKPDHQTLSNEKKKPSGYALARVPIPHSPKAASSGLVAVGSNIYNIAHTSYPAPSSKVWILDCRSHTWRESETPTLGENLLSVSASVVDENIYGAAIYRDEDSRFFKKMVKVLDTKAQTWDPVPVSSSKVRDYFLFGSACIDGKFQVNIEGVMSAYNSKEGRWDLVRRNMGRCVLNNFMYGDFHCVVENVLYSALGGKYIVWYDTKKGIWRDVKGLDGLPEFPPCRNFVKLADQGGKMVVLWTKDKDLSNEKMIWCAEITLEKHKSFEIRGKVGWFDHVLTVPITSRLVKLLAVTV